MVRKNYFEFELRQKKMGEVVNECIGMQKRAVIFRNFCNIACIFLIIHNSHERILLFTTLSHVLIVFS